MSKDYSAYSHHIDTSPGIHHYGFMCTPEKRATREVELYRKCREHGVYCKVLDKKIEKASGRYIDVYITYEIKKR